MVIQQLVISDSLPSILLSYITFPINEKNWRYTLMIFILLFVLKISFCHLKSHFSVVAIFSIEVCYGVTRHIKCNNIYSRIQIYFTWELEGSLDGLQNIICASIKLTAPLYKSAPSQQSPTIIPASSTPFFLWRVPGWCWEEKKNIRFGYEWVMFYHQFFSRSYVNHVASSARAIKFLKISHIFFYFPLAWL